MAEGPQIVEGVLLLEVGGLTLFSHGLEEAGMDPMLLGGFVQSLHEFSENAIGDRGLKTVVFRQKKMRMIEILSDKQLVLVTSADMLDEPLDHILERFRREIREEKLIQEKEIFVIPDFLANAGGVTCSYFEQVQSNMNYFWEKDEVLGKLDLQMTSAFLSVSNLARKRKIFMRDAAYVIAIMRVVQACKDRGWV